MCICERSSVRNNTHTLILHHHTIEISQLIQRKTIFTQQRNGKNIILLKLSLLVTWENSTGSFRFLQFSHTITPLPAALVSVKFPISGLQIVFHYNCYLAVTILFQELFCCRGRRPAANFKHNPLSSTTTLLRFLFMLIALICVCACVHECR